MPLVYLDNCALQRPLDDRSQFRVRMEAEAIEAVLRAVETGSVELLSSDVLVAEGSASPDPTRRDFVGAALGVATSRVALSTDVERNAAPFGADGMKAVDALHLASAVHGRADYFCTTDDRLLKKARAADTRPVRVVTPAELAITLGL